MFLQRSFTGRLAAAALLLGTMTAQGALLTFEKLADGVTTPSGSVGAQYAASGVIFTGGGLATQPTFRPHGQLSSGIATPAAPPNFFFITTQQRTPSAPFDINVLFSIPVFSAAGDVVVNPIASVTVTAYDAADAVLGTNVIAAGASTWIAGQFSFASATPIARINLTPSLINVSAGLDNLSFDGAPVPEPSTFGAGLLLVLALGVRRYNVAVRRSA